MAKKTLFSPQNHRHAVLYLSHSPPRGLLYSSHSGRGLSKYAKTVSKSAKSSLADEKLLYDSQIFLIFANRT